MDDLVLNRVLHSVDTMLDRLAARLAVWALTRLYGEKCPDYEPTCKCCEVNKLIDDIREIFAE